jgi:hypothetical protein
MAPRRDTPTTLHGPPRSGTVFADPTMGVGRATGGNQGNIHGSRSLERLRGSY